MVSQSTISIRHQERGGGSGQRICSAQRAYVRTISSRKTVAYVRFRYTASLDSIAARRLSAKPSWRVPFGSTVPYILELDPTRYSMVHAVLTLCIMFMSISHVAVFIVKVRLICNVTCMVT